ncbi:1,4-beta-N-acetylmuramidase, partial [Gardnerella vaginalis]
NAGLNGCKNGGSDQATRTSSIDEVAREVINGAWGNGNERKQRLTQAGYDYDTVQKRVNELL